MSRCLSSSSCWNRGREGKSSRGSIPRALAASTALSLIEFLRQLVAETLFESFEFAAFQFLLALRANHADQTLSDHRFQGRGHQVGLDPHVDQSRQCRGRVVGVQRREYQVTGERGLDGDFRRLDVTNFAHENDVGIMSQNRAQPAGKGQSRLAGDLDLIDTVKLIFDRILDRNDLALNFVDL